MELHEQVKQTRLALRMTQAQLGAALGVPRKTIAQWERGEALPEYPRLLELALQQLQIESGVWSLDAATQAEFRQGFAMLQETNRWLRETMHEAV